MTRPLPLQGVTVIAVEQAVAAPLATARMADAGARVIKIERAEGDFARGYDSAAGGDSSYFAWANHGKESIALNFKSAADAELLHHMIDNADVFVQNLAPGALARAGFSSSVLRDRNPNLVTCDISGYGASPAVADKLAYDLLVQAESGLIGVSGGPNELGRIGVSICDIGTAITAYTGVLEALLARASSGVGSGFAVSLFDVAAEWMTVPYIHEAHGDGGPERVGLRHPSIAPYGAFATSDGKLTLISVQNEREWVRLCEEVLGAADLATDSRFASNNDRVHNRTELEQVLESLIAELTAESFGDRLRGARIAFGNVSSLEDLLTHPALRLRSIHTTEHDEITLPAHPIQWSAPRAGSPRPVPTIDGDGERLRQEFGFG